MCVTAGDCVCARACVTKRFGACARVYVCVCVRLSSHAAPSACTRVPPCVPKSPPALIPSRPSTRPHPPPARRRLRAHGGSLLEAFATRNQGRARTDRFGTRRTWCILYEREILYARDRESGSGGVGGGMSGLATATPWWSAQGREGGGGGGREGRDQGRERERPREKPSERERPRRDRRET